MTLPVSFRRFPVPHACVVLAAASAGIFLANPHTEELRWILILLPTAVAGFFAAFAAHLFAEARGWPRGRNMIFAALAALAVAPQFLLHDIMSGKLIPPAAIFLLSGMVLLAITLPFLASEENRHGTSRHAWRLTLTMLAGLLGPALILGAFTLLGFHIAGRFPYFSLVPSALVLAGPVLMLHFWPAASPKPEDADGKPDAVFFKGFMQIAALLMLPVLYWSAILFVTDWPRYAALDSTIPVLGAVAISCHLLAGSPGEAAHGIVRRLRRFYPAAAALPMIAVLPQFLPLAQYLSDALAILLALWVIGVGLHALFIRPRPVAIPMAMLAAMLILAGFGPLNAQTLLDWNRLPLFERILARNGILNGVKIMPARNDLPHSQAVRLDKVIRALSAPPMADLFRENLASHGMVFADEIWNADCIDMLVPDRKICSARGSHKRVESIIASLGLWRETYFERSGFNLRAGAEFRFGDPPHMDTDGFDYLHREVTIWSSHNAPQAVPASNPPLEITFGEAGQSLVFTTQTGTSVDIDFTPLNEWLIGYAGRIGEKEFYEMAVLEGESDGLRLRLYPYHINIKTTESGWTLQQATFALLVGREEQRI